MRRSRHTPRQLFGLTLTLVGLLSWHILPIPHPELAVRAANRVRGAEPTGQTVSRAVANGRIAFGSFVSSEGNAQFDIYTMNPDGSDRKQLTFGQDLESGPVWSPDGTKIAFQRFNSNFGGIFVMNADGSDQRRLTQSRDDSSPTWSPDGTKIAFQRWNSNIPGIFVMNADGSDQRAVASGFHGPAWSPAGLKLAVASDGIYLINVDGSNQTQITQPIDSDWDLDYGPAWSPDGSKITFTRGTECFFGGCETEHLWVVNADGSNPTKLVDSPHGTSAWSPDGTKIIFSKGQNCHNNTTCLDLFVMNPDGSGLTNITNTDGKSEYSPSWQALPLTLPNPIDDPQLFVRQHYLDFLSREPDPAGLAFWTNEITSCGTDQLCIDAKRIDVSAAFYLSIEFQQTGYLVERIYKAAYGDAVGTSTFGGTHQLSVPVIRLNEFLLDTQQIGNGVVVNQSGWETVLENNKQAFTAEFVQRSRFTTAFPQSMTPSQFVDTLNTNAGNPLSQSERNQLVSDLSSGGRTRAQVLSAVAEDPDLNNAEFNRGFVLMQYFGYLRRNPNDPQDTDYSGYDFWLGKLNQFNGNFVQAEMVKAFITSIEYRQRFGP